MGLGRRVCGCVRGCVRVAVRGCVRGCVCVAVCVWLSVAVCVAVCVWLCVCGCPWLCAWLCVCGCPWLCAWRCAWLSVAACRHVHAPRDRSPEVPMDGASRLDSVGGGHSRHEDLGDLMGEV